MLTKFKKVLTPIVESILRERFEYSFLKTLAKNVGLKIDPNNKATISIPARSDVSVIVQYLENNGWVRSKSNKSNFLKVIDGVRYTINVNATSGFVSFI